VSSFTLATDALDSNDLAINLKNNATSVFKVDAEGDTTLTGVLASVGISNNGTLGTNGAVTITGGGLTLDGGAVIAAQGIAIGPGGVTWMRGAKGFMPYALGVIAAGDCASTPAIALTGTASVGDPCFAGVAGYDTVDAGMPLGIACRVLNSTTARVTVCTGKSGTTLVDAGYSVGTLSL
jgi:hypothetical protein